MRIIKTLLKIVLGLVLVIIVVVIGAALSLRANVPSTDFGVEAPLATAQDPRPVLIYGGNRKTGYEVTKLLRARGQAVTVAVRATSDRSLVAPLGVDFVVADAMDVDAVNQVIVGSDYQAIITTIGCFSCEPLPDFIGNRNIIDAAKTNGGPRIILITSIGAGDSSEHTNLLTRLALGKILPLKTQAEDYLRDSGLPYTIIRPGGLRGEDGTPTSNTGLLYDDETAFGFIHRSDLGYLIVAALDDKRTVGKTLAAVDPSAATPF
jgi:uncharacterized protein YbjT (DUF2867 family)